METNQLTLLETIGIFLGILVSIYTLVFPLLKWVWMRWLNKKLVVSPLDIHFAHQSYLKEPRPLDLAKDEKERKRILYEQENFEKEREQNKNRPKVQAENSIRVIITNKSEQEVCIQKIEVQIFNPFRGRKFWHKNSFSYFVTKTRDCLASKSSKEFDSKDNPKLGWLLNNNFSSKWRKSNLEARIWVTFEYQGVVVRKSESFLLYSCSESLLEPHCFDAVRL